MYPGLESAAQARHRLFRVIERRPTKMIRGLEHHFCEYRMREVGLFIPEKSRLWRDPIAACQHSKRTPKNEDMGK